MLSSDSVLLLVGSGKFRTCDCFRSTSPVLKRVLSVVNVALLFCSGCSVVVVAG